MKMLSIHRPLPSIEIRTPARLSTSVNSWLVNWLPWSVLKIFGLLYLARASSKASVQKSLSSVFDKRQESTVRVAQSKPSCWRRGSTWIASRPFPGTGTPWRASGPAGSGSRAPSTAPRWPPSELTVGKLLAVEPVQ